ncbi:sialidase family protein [Massilia sp. METH4]|uniref:sialidase family protein n=1 Tax=Massilia sp. METH4 TaxID=3123041 RepID=UPI0030CFCA57
MKQNTFARAVRLIATLALAVAVSGCVTKTIATDPTKAPATQGQSPVVLSTTSNTAEVRGFDTIRLVRFSEPGENPLAVVTIDTYELRRVAPGMARDTALFVGNLPAGKYYITDLVDARSNLKLNVSRARHDTLGVFAVTAGAPVDLGRLIVTPLNTKVLHGRSRLVQSNAELLKRYSPEYARLFTVPVQGGWTKPPLETDRVEEYALTRPVGADCMSELDDGRVAAASRLGSVLLRDRGGRWNIVRGPGIESLLCVLPVTLPDADLLAVGEFGALLKHVPGATTLTPVDRGNLPLGNLMRIYGNPNVGWYVAHQDGDRLTFFHSRRLEGGDWQSVGSESVKAAFWGGEKQFFMWPTPTGFAYSLYKGPMHFYEYATGAWTKRPLPESRRIVDLFVSPNNVLSVETIKGGMAKAFGAVHVSRDDGRTWTAVEGPFKVMRSPAVELADGTLLLYAGEVFGKVQLQASGDGGKTWKARPENGQGGQMLPLNSGGLLAYDRGYTGVFSIHSSKDGAQTWTQEYTTFDSKFLEMLSGQK